MDKYIGTVNTANGSTWIRVWKEIEDSLYKEECGTVDSLDRREFFKEKYNIKEFTDLRQCSFKYII